MPQASLYNDLELIEILLYKGKGDVLEYVSDTLKDNKQLVMKAVQVYGFELRFASERLRDDYDIVMAASLTNLDAIDFASDFRIRSRLSF
jgi:hypothetical protein